MANKDMAGKTLCEFDFLVERGKIREFAAAIGDTNPMYTDPTCALSKGFNDVVAPVTFPTSFPLHMATENFVLQAMKDLEMNPGTSIHGECEIVYTRPICAGEVLKAEIVVGSIYEKEVGEGKKWSFVELDVRFRDPDGGDVAEMKNVFIER